MSKSLKRVKSALFAADPSLEVIETGQATTAKAAAESLGCAVDQIAKSILFEGELTAQLYLFVTAGARRVDLDLGGAFGRRAVGQNRCCAHPRRHRICHRRREPRGAPDRNIVTFFDESLLEYQKIYAAAGTPVHVFGCAPQQMAGLCQGRISAFSQ